LYLHLPQKKVVIFFCEEVKKKFFFWGWKNFLVRYFFQTGFKPVYKPVFWNRFIVTKPVYKPVTNRFYGLVTGLYKPVILTGLKVTAER
jgi:hypothetical protein